jgi:tetratricopeptide (TPR) repeat protein
MIRTNTGTTPQGEAMAVLIKCYSVVVRNATLAAKYQGGTDANARDCPNNTFCADEHVSRVGFMQASDAEPFIAELAAKGLTPTRDGLAADVALTAQDSGFVRACDWLELARYKGTPMAWLAGTLHGNLHAPPGWTPGKGLQHMTTEEARQLLEFVRTEGDIDVYRDKVSGQEMYVGRTAEDRTRHDELYKRAGELIEGLLILQNHEPPPLLPDERRRLDEAAGLYREVVRINPRNWAAMWLLGKVHQLLAQYERGLEWFSRAHRVNPDHADVAREASIAAMDAGKPEEAIPFCQRALQVKPGDPGLRANLALATLFCGKPPEARDIAAALTDDPANGITATIVRIIDEVLAGTRPCPHHVRDLNGDQS